MIHDDSNDSALRWQLRQLPREREPGRDLWPGIAAQIRSQASRPQGRTRLARWWPVGLAAAASLTLAVGLLLRGPLLPAPEPGPVTFAYAINRQADAIAIEYQAALSQFEGAPVPAELAPALDELDRSAAEIRQALAAEPEAVFLIEQLRRTYQRRLALTQQALG